MGKKASARLSIGGLLLFGTTSSLLAKIGGPLAIRGSSSTEQAAAAVMAVWGLLFLSHIAVQAGAVCLESSACKDL